MVIVGGYGGFPVGNIQYSGISCLADVWAYNGTIWEIMTSYASFGPRAWFAMMVYHGADSRIDPSSTLSPKLFLFSGW